MATPIPTNDVRFTIEEAARVTGAEVLGAAPHAFVGITTDSRQDVRGRLFVALRGERFDGHRFLDRVAEAGAAAALVDCHVDTSESLPLLRVEDTLAALGELAGAHRRRWPGKVVAVAGSAGKTTTRSVTAAMLQALLPGEVLQSPGNLNNRIGVPMVLLALTASHRVAVVEIGTNLRGEVAALSRLAGPDISILTLVGVEHSEGLGTIDEIEAEEGDLLASTAPGGVAVTNADDPRARRQLLRAPAARRMLYGEAEDAGYRIVTRQTLGVHRSLVVVATPSGTVSVRVPLLGRPAAYATAAALAVLHAVARELELQLPSDERLSVALAGAGEPGRLRAIERADGVVVIDDTYNSNPASVAMSVSAATELARSRGGRLLIVLGEMLELGEAAVEHHRKVGLEVAEFAPAGLVAVCGDAVEFVGPAIDAGIDAAFAPTAEDAIPLVLERVAPRAVVLVKASRGVQAERIVRTLLAEEDGNA